MKRILFAAMAAIISSAALMPLQAGAEINVRIFVPTAPPPVVVEAAPAPRPGHIWAPGYWSWNGSKHVWNGGHWERARQGYRYERADWRRDGDQWRFQEGGWKEAKKAKKQKHHDDDDDDHGHGHGHGNDKHHCPPGQAKKGNC